MAGKKPGPKPGTGGRPPIPDIDPSVQETIVSLLQEGQYLSTACNFAGVAKSSVFRWFQQGRRDKHAGRSSSYVDFWESCKKARSTAEISDIRAIQEAGQVQWQAKAWIRERSSRARWGKQEKVEHSGGLKIVREIVGVNPEEV